MFKVRLRDVYLQEWRTNMSLTSRNRLCVSIKTEFKYEQYLNINNRCLRIALTRVRLSSHLFMIERGRWGKNRLQVTDRLCSQCGVVEDEFHCIVSCPRYNNERERCSLVTTSTNYREFIKLFQNYDMDAQLRLATLCYRVQKEYQQFI